MTEKKHYQTIRRKKKSPAGIIFVVIGIFAVILCVGAVGIFMMSQTVDAVVHSSDIIISVTVSGNDIVVKLYESDEADKLESIELNMEGYSLPPGYSTKSVPLTSYPKIITYDSVAFGMHGNMQVSIKGIFKDGTSKIIWMDTLKMS
ncbi:MAG: hypothetical protein Q4Q53_02245 [Methanocorpusculum sp.]|nr:hypothetical protein [Methanocorpusculum sp.]